MTIYLVKPKGAWEADFHDGFFGWATLKAEGFLHAADIHTVLDVANRKFAEETAMVLVTVAGERVTAQIRWEGKPEGVRYPHIYGLLNADAVTEVTDLEKDAKGQYKLPCQVPAAALQDEVQMYRGILNAYPYPVVFVDNSYTIRYINQYATYYYYTKRGYENLIGKSLFACHDMAESQARIEQSYEKMKRDGKPRFLSVTPDNLRLYMQPVKDEAGNWIGFFERFELNQQISFPVR